MSFASQASIEPRYNFPDRHSGKYPPDWDARRKTVYRRDDYACQECGLGGGPHSGESDVELHAHHIQPLSAGGTHHLTNLITLCRRCHDEQHNHTLGEQRGTLRWLIGTLSRHPVWLLVILVVFGFAIQSP
jgi:5-methylcytosine-specific restriction endonuclease McrA